MPDCPNAFLPDTWYHWLSTNHYVVAVVATKCRVVLWLDSIRSKNGQVPEQHQERLTRLVRSQDPSPGAWAFLSLRVPQQRGVVDCGIYAAQWLGTLMICGCSLTLMCVCALSRNFGVARCCGCVGS